ncbi:hypothetical protein [Scytonema sp. NUACC21]
MSCCFVKTDRELINEYLLDYMQATPNKIHSLNGNMSRNAVSCVVSLTQPSGVELSVNLVLDEKPTRQDQKLKTLSQYVQQYPSGWKKRLELANVLYAMGRWEQKKSSLQNVERKKLLLKLKVLSAHQIFLNFILQ